MNHHPLFPAKDDLSDPPEVLTIHVMRAGEGYASRAFEPGELMSLETLYELFGGGQYTLIARNERHVTARMTYPLNGPSKPLNEGATVGHPNQAPQAQPAAPAPAAAPGGSGLEVLLPALLGMIADSNKTTAAMFADMAQRDREAANRHIENMQALHDRHERSQAAMFKQLNEAREQRGADQSAEWLMRGQELGAKQARELGKLVADRMPDGEDKDDLLEQVGQIFGPMMAGAQTFQQGHPQGPPPHPHASGPAPAPPPPNPGNGARPGRSPFGGLRPQGQPINEPDEDELEQ